MTNQFAKKDLIPPKKQVLIFAGAALVGMLGARLVAKNELTIWLMGVSCLLLFSMMNNGMSFFAENYKTYLIHSIYAFVFLLIGVVGLSTLLSGMSIFDTGGYRAIVLVILVANFLFIAMIITVKGILSMLEEKDETL
ncbi:MAG: hypothetical protein ACRBFS_04330 [Aureispira sp.]